MADKTKYYPFLPKGSSLESFKKTDPEQFTFAEYGDVFSGSYPLTSSIIIENYYSTSGFDASKRKIYALKNTLNNYTYLSPHYAYSSSLGDKGNQELILISIPSIYYGSSIQKGSVQLKCVASGSVVGVLEDINKNGELIQTTGSINQGKVAGIVLYNEGFIIITGSWSIDANYIEMPYGFPSWLSYGSSILVSSSFDLNFEGTNYINTITMLAHADKGELNHSNNPTFIKYSNNNIQQVITSSVGYYEYPYNEIKNTVKYPYENYTGSLERQTYISKIGIYDENKNLIGIAKLAKPIKKTENRDFTFKLKLDI